MLILCSFFSYCAQMLQGQIILMIKGQFTTEATDNKQHSIKVTVTEFFLPFRKLHITHGANV